MMNTELAWAALLPCCPNQRTWSNVTRLFREKVLYYTSDPCSLYQNKRDENGINKKKVTASLFFNVEVHFHHVYFEKTTGSKSCRCIFGKFALA